MWLIVAETKFEVSVANFYWNSTFVSTRREHHSDFVEIEEGIWAWERGPGERI